MDANSVISSIIGALINSVACCYICVKVGHLKVNYNNPKLYLLFIILNVILIFNYVLVSSYIKVAIITIIFALFIYLALIKDLRLSIALSLTTQIIIFLSELISILAILLLFNNDQGFSINSIFGKLLTNVIVSGIAVFLSQFKAFKKIYLKLLNVTNKTSFSNLIFISFLLIISVNFFLAFPYYKIDTLTVVLVNTILIFVYSYIILRYIEQKNRYLDISDKYSLSEASLKEVQNNVNRLMALNHENKNQLITIRTMVANKDKDVLKNIDAIVDEKIKDDKELKIRTSVISNTMLGSLIYSKLLTMKEKDITHNLHISKAINKSHLINLGDKTNVDICKIVGVYLDNAIEAVMEADVKEINIDLYLEDNYFCISIANTFKGKVNLDIITDYGYTTKSNGHGYGLSLVKEVIKDNNALSSKTDIIDNKVFVQNLKIKM